MLSFNETLQKIEELRNHCPGLREGTRKDPTYMTFSNAAVADPDEGMWYSVNSNLDTVYGIDCINQNISKGRFGLPMVVIWIKDARKHHTWDADSDKLVKIKLDNIITALIGEFLALAVLMIQDLSVDKNPDEQPTREKRRVVSGSKTSETLQRPSKQLQTASTSTKQSTIIVLSSDDQKHHKSDDDSDPVFIGGTFLKNLTGGSFPKKHKIIELCPLSKPGENCSQCQVEDRPGGKDLACHCGAKRIWLNGGRVRVAKNHWASEACKEKTDDLKETTEVTSYFGRSVTAKNTIEIDCPGLNDDTWKRDRAVQSIATFVTRSFSIYRGNVRHEICQELFGQLAQESKLIPAQKSQLITTLDARSKWQIKRHGDRNSIYSSQCSKTFMAKKTIKNAYAEAETMKYGRDNYMSDNINAFTPTVLKSKDARLLSTSIEKASKGNFSEFCTAVAVKAERENAGKTTRGMKIDSCLDKFVMTLGAISPRALNLFNDNFAGRSTRSLRMIRAREGMQLLDGIQFDNFKRITQVLKDLGYSGPVAAASNQTLPELVKDVIKNKELCSKIRAYTLQVPLPNVPTFVVALIASCYKETSEDILENHKKFLELSQDAGINILSIGADGAPTELCAQTMLAETATQYISYSNPTYNIHVKVPLIGHPPRPVVMVQGPKHARKTGTNQLSS
ncbi:uncharacterized protein MELLADRAFT_95461 [Melampsora larici-populina 98AG31]|uniref:Uncharacterized protein n=1 Tax=Melampsora larici-populina (strain 98AG31 / pathotype 3-4-7) TaxID=747676 RepID=F4S9F0_MELLP|nr:uncharacterized protein MELLADRAFT_95461 [Melampsora larici-populina 98AG31]EGF98711.1 hypothetical protein MELLADRAFT_95461 [Melampsora larici-populina 98AG31]